MRRPPPRAGAWRGADRLARAGRLARHHAGRARPTAAATSACTGSTPEEEVTSAAKGPHAQRSSPPRSAVAFSTAAGAAGSTGLVMKSQAPARMAATARPISSSPVIRMTGK